MALVALSCAACAPKVVVSLPTGAVRPDALAETTFARIIEGCQTVRTWSAELAVAGRVRGQTVRARVFAGTSAGGDLRLEGVAPFGAPLFVLAVSRERASLLLPREDLVLQDAPADAVLDALVGLRLSAADLHALLSGCLVASPSPRNGRVFEGATWLAVDVGDQRTAYLHRGNAGWRLEAARLGSIDVGYGAFDGPAAREIRLVADRGGRDAVRLQLRLSQVEENITFPVGAFELEVPPAAQSLSLVQLRARGLGLSGR